MKSMTKRKGAGIILVGLFALFLFLNPFVFPQTKSHSTDIRKVSGEQIELIHVGDVALEEYEIKFYVDGIIGQPSFCVDEDGVIYMRDEPQQQIYIFGHDGKLAGKIGKKKSDPSEFGIGKITTRGNKIYVYDIGRIQIHVYDKSGEFIRSFQTEGGSTLIARDKSVVLLNSIVNNNKNTAFYNETPWLGIEYVFLEGGKIERRYMCNIQDRLKELPPDDKGGIWFNATGDINDAVYLVDHTPEVKVYNSDNQLAEVLELSTPLNPLISGADTLSWVEDIFYLDKDSLLVLFQGFRIYSNDEPSRYFVSVYDSEHRTLYCDKEIFFSLLHPMAVGGPEGLLYVVTKYNHDGVVISKYRIGVKI